MLCGMSRRSESDGMRVNISLDARHAAMLSALAERMHVNEGTLAKSLLSTALEESNPDARFITELLDGIDGTFARATAATERIDRGDFVELKDI